MEFRKDVRVIWSDQVGGVVARAVNLSPTGILVDAPTETPCPVGSDVLCDLALPRGSRLLRGRVAHRRDLSSAKVGMGIEFVDLSPRMVAELRDVVDESERTTQPVKVRFEGTRQVVSARALPTVDGFRFATALPFLRAEAEVEIALSPDAQISTKGWVSGVALDHAQDGTPRLVIDVRVAERTSPGGTWVGSMEPEPEPEPSLASAPGWETQPEPSPDHRDFGATTETRAAAGLTEIVRVPSPGSRRSWLGAGLLALGIVFAIFAIFALIVLSAPLRGSTPPMVTRPPTPPAAPVLSASPSIIAPAAPEPAPAAPEPLPDPMPEALGEPSAEALAAPGEFTVGLVGSLEGAVRYPLRAPYGVAFNLPHARATTKVGTYEPTVEGLRAVWVRDLPGGGTHLRFVFSGHRPTPEVELRADGVHVIAR